MINSPNASEQSTTGVFCVLDIETAGGDLNNIPKGFELLLCGVKWQGQYHFYERISDKLRLVADLLQSFNGALVTFNGKRFDLPILNEHLWNILGRVIKVSTHYDILAEISRIAGHRISLANLTYYTLGYQKEPWDHSQNARIWKENPELLRNRNREDLNATEAIYKLIMNREPLNLGNKTIILPRVPTG